MIRLANRLRRWQFAVAAWRCRRTARRVAALQPHVQATGLPAFSPQELALLREMQGALSPEEFLRRLRAICEVKKRALFTVLPFPAGRG